MKRRFILMKKVKNGFTNTDSVFTGRFPLQAANKAAKRGHKKIFLRESGQKQIREYLGKIVKVKLKEDTAFADKGDVLKKGKAKYKGIIEK